MRACCMVSEVLEESGLDREHLRLIRRQLLQGVILLCQWQLERLDASGSRSTGSRKARVRQVTID